MKEADASGLWEHVSSLRNHLLLGGVVFIAAWIAIFSYGSEILLKWFLYPLSGQELVFLSPLGPFFFTIQISLYAAVALVFPLWLSLLLHFIFPALSLRKRIASIGFVGVSLFLSIASLLVAYFYLIPTTLTFLLNFVVPQTSLLLSADSYMSFFLLEFCIAFVILQIPVVITLLSYIGLLNPYVLVRQRRLLYIGLVILLAFLTPTTDMFTLLAVSVPAVLMAEAGIAVAKRLYTNPQQSEY